MIHAPLKIFLCTFIVTHTSLLYTMDPTLKWLYNTSHPPKKTSDVSLKKTVTKSTLTKADTAPSQTSAARFEYERLQQLCRQQRDGMLSELGRQLTILRGNTSRVARQTYPQQIQSTFTIRLRILLGFHNQKEAARRHMERTQSGTKQVTFEESKQAVEARNCQVLTLQPQICMRTFTITNLAQLQAELNKLV